MDEEYKMADAVLGRTTQEKDLGVTFSGNMKVSDQCGIAASKGNQILGLIRRTITYMEKQLIVPLYKAIVRPHLEYCICHETPRHVWRGPLVVSKVPQGEHGDAFFIRLFKS